MHIDTDILMCSTMAASPNNKQDQKHDQQQASGHRACPASIQNVFKALNARFVAATFFAKLHFVT
jgi:hypothetical protein